MNGQKTKKRQQWLINDCWWFIMISHVYCCFIIADGWYRLCRSIILNRYLTKGVNLHNLISTIDSIMIDINFFASINCSMEKSSSYMMELTTIDTYWSLHPSHPYHLWSHPYHFALPLRPMGPTRNQLTLGHTARSAPQGRWKDFLLCHGFRTGDWWNVG